MSNIHLFRFHDHDVRITDQNGDPWFVAHDVGERLQIANIHQALTRLDDDEKSTIILNDSTGRPREMVIISESGLYRLIGSSRKRNLPEVKEFQDWIYKEVLPTLRKAGQYAVQPIQPAPSNGLAPLDVLKSAVEYLIAHDQKLTDHESRLVQLEARTSSDTGYISLIAYCRLKGMDKSLSELRALGSKLRKRAVQLGIKLGKVPDERWGEVNSYPRQLLEEELPA